jgi:hypothetical protein
MALSRRRIFTVLGVLCVIAAGMAAVSLRIRQHIIRVHAQRTLDDIQHLKIGSSRTCQIFSEWQHEWGSHVSYEGTCDDPNRFYMDINVQHPAYIWPTCFEGQSGRVRFILVRGMCGVYEALSGKTIVFMARVVGVKGVVTQKFSQVFTVMRDDLPDEHMPATVAASAMTSARPGRSWDRQAATQQQNLHPGYRVFVGTTRINADYMPGGRVFYISAEVGPEGTNVDSERLFRFDLSCLGRWRPCSERDLMPAAYDQYEMDVRRSQSPSP